MTIWSLCKVYTPMVPAGQDRQRTILLVNRAVDYPVVEGRSSGVFPVPFLVYGREKR
jgi:hypothetical protein